MRQVLSSLALADCVGCHDDTLLSQEFGDLWVREVWVVFNERIYLNYILFVARCSHIFVVGYCFRRGASCVW
jgi:hypothetical protein